MDVLGACPLCRCRRIPPLRRYAVAHLRRCRDCGFVFAGMRPSTDETRRQYEGYGLADASSPITRARYEELLAGFEGYRRTGRILDVGCGEGEFLQAAAAYGWSVHGTESTEGALARNRARGIAMTLAPLQRDELPKGAFDVVTAFEVVEHVSDPAAEVALIAGLLRPGGLLYVTTPNFGSLSRRLLGPRWNVIEYPEHLNYFTRATLQRCFADAGFETLAMTSTGVSPGRLIEGLRRARPGAVTQRAAVDERVRETIERAAVLRAAKRLADRTLGVLGAGDTLKGRFRRRDTG